MRRTPEVVIIGAGISGLCVAHWLHRAGVRVTVLEQNRWPGGTMRTLHHQGWLVETGPNSALETTPLFDDLFDELGILEQKVYADETSQKRYILREGRLHALPMSVWAFLRTPLWSVAGKLRLAGELFVGRGNGDESVAQFVERRLGREFLDYAINPFIAGVYAGNPEDLSVRAAFPKLFALEDKYGGLIKGMISGAGERKRRAETAKDRARMFSFHDGMQTLPLSITKELGKGVNLRTRVVGFDARRGEIGRRFAVRTRIPRGTKRFHADALVMSVPAYVASSLVRPLAPDVSGVLADIGYPPVTQVFLGYRESQVGRPLDGFGFLIPRNENRSILGTIWSSSLFRERSPQGHVALTTFVGGSRQADLAGLDDRQLLGLVAGELRTIVGVSGDPVFSRIVRWRKAIPQYRVGYGRVSEALGLMENEYPGLFFCSNYRGGISVGDCVVSARNTADRLLQFLGVTR